MILDSRHVLTCAHILTGAGPGTGDTPPDVEVIVDPVGLPNTAPVQARIAPDGWAPPTDRGRGDVALLKLSQPLPDGCGAPLSRLSMRQTLPVYVCGFSETLPNGMVVDGKLVGYQPGGERVQLNTSSDLRIRAGFSGAGVVDERNGRVVGMVVTVHGTAGVSWIIPVEAIVNHIRAVDQWVTGAPSIDDSFPSPDQSGDEEIEGRIADFLAGRTPGNVLIIITGAPGSKGLVALSRAIMLSSRHRRPPDGGRPPGGEDPNTAPLGTIDLAVDAAGKTPQAVKLRLTEWAGAPGGGTPEWDARLVAEAAPTLIIGNIDAATDVDALLSGVVQPIVEQAAKSGMRLVLTFQGESVRARLALLKGRIKQFVETRAAVRDLRQRLVDPDADEAGDQPSATELATRFAALNHAFRGTDRDGADQGGANHSGPDHGGADRGGDLAEWLDRLASCERAVDRALSTAVATRRRLDAMRARRDELRGLLEAHRSRAAVLGEDVALSVIYRRAHELLWVAPCDVAAAAAAVLRYADEVRRRIGSGQ
jgi:hypothetical protein